MTHDPEIRGVRRSLRVPRAVEREVSDEIAFHIESRARELNDGGMPLDQAREAAEREFGDVAASRRELAAVDRRRMRRRRLLAWLEAIAQDLRFAARSLRRSPAFSLTAGSTLAIGLGACTAIFAVVNAVLLRPLPYGTPERLVAPLFDMPGVDLTHEPQSASTYFTYRRLARTIEDIGLYEESAVNVSLPGGTADAQRVTSASVTASLLRLLEVPPLLGRTFTDDEDRPGGPPVVMISETMWRERFAASESAVGSLVDVDGKTRRIVGVLPLRFRFPQAATRLWMPLSIDPVALDEAAFNYSSVARLKPGVTPADARREFASLLPRVADLYPRFVRGITTAAILAQVKPVPVIVPLRDDMTAGVASPLWMLAASAGLVLLVACANVANLALVRADARQRELGVREALGAGRARIISQFFAESGVLAAFGAAAGLAAAAIVVRLLATSGPADIPRLGEARIDVAATAFVGAATVFVLGVCGAIPALRAWRGRPALIDGSRGGTGNRAQQRLRGALVTGQIAVSLVVLAASGLLLRTFERLHAVRPGFEPDHVATFWMSLPRSRYSTASVARFAAELTARASRLPGVQSVGITSRLPLESYGLNQNPLYPKDDGAYATKLPPLQLFASVSGGYFSTMGIRIIAGRNFDRLDGQRVDEAIISATTARQFWKDSTGVAALGRQFRALPGAPLYTVIGVAADVRDSSLAFPPGADVYFPEVVGADSTYKQIRRTLALAVRTSGNPAAIESSVRRLVNDLDPTIPLFDVKPMSAVYAASLARLTFVMLILGSAAVVTLLLGMVGLYGVLAYLVTLRTRELGIRIALGAAPRRVAAAMARHGLVLAGAGVALGLLVFAVVARFLGAMLFGVKTSDPLTLAAATSLLLVIAAAASWLPARRAARIDPADALRSD